MKHKFKKVLTEKFHNEFLCCYSFELNKSVDGQWNCQNCRASLTPDDIKERLKAEKAVEDTKMKQTQPIQPPQQHPLTEQQQQKSPENIHPQLPLQQLEPQQQLQQAAIATAVQDQHHNPGHKRSRIRKHKSKTTTPKSQTPTAEPKTPPPLPPYIPH